MVFLETFDAKGFVSAEVEEIKKLIGKEKALVAVSGGVDSMTCAVLTHKAIGEKLICVMLDDAFMRQGEPEHVAETLAKPPFNVPIKIVDVRERFLTAMKNLVDAEEKRKKFRETFYQVLGETAKKEGCKILVQGTIKADIIETVGGVKTQHNVLEQVGINPMERFGFNVVEPLVTLLKWQVRMVARHLGLPSEFAERQPFPGPGLSVRVVGEIRSDKLDTVRRVTFMAERELSKHKPSQYFTVILDCQEASDQTGVVHIQEAVARLLNVPSRNVHVRIFKDRATGMKGGERRYGKVVGITVETLNAKAHQPSVQSLISLQATIITENPEVTRIFYAVKDTTEKKPYVIAIRAIQTQDFLTAQVSEIPWPTLNTIAEEAIEQCHNISTVYYDVTPKPPSTVEME